MGRSPCCSKGELNSGAWTVTEDKILTGYIEAHGEGKWRNVSKKSGLKRCGKSCRLRWLNYLRPDIKRGNISDDEEDLIIRLHNLLGNRWSLIAGRLPGRTDNEIKNYWNTTLVKKIQSQPSSSPTKQRPISRSMNKKPATGPLIAEPLVPPLKVEPQVVQTKALKYTKIPVPSHHQPAPSSPNSNHGVNSTETKNSEEIQAHQSHFLTLQVLDNMMMDYGIGEFSTPYSLDSNFLNFGCNDFQVSDNVNAEDDYRNNLLMTSNDSLRFDEPRLKDGRGNDLLEPNASIDLGSLFFSLDSEEWS